MLFITLLRSNILKNFKQILSRPSSEGRPWIIWIWNLKISKEEMISQLKALISHGFGGILVRPGKEMTPPYLSEEFFELFRIVLETAKDNNIGIRLADDFSMPWSGCFTTLLNQNHSLRAQGLVLAETRMLETKETLEFPAAEPGKTIVLVARVKNQQVSLSETRVMPLVPGKPVEWKSQNADWRIFVFNKTYLHDLAGGYLPNAYNTRTAQLYVQNVLNVFKKRFSKYIGSSFRGFLSELPACQPAGGIIPWDDDLVVKFRTKYKKDLLKYLPALYCDAPQAARIRNQVYSFLDQSIYERFACPLETWARNSRLSQWVLHPERPVSTADNALVDGNFTTDKGCAAVGLQNCDGLDESFPFLRAMVDINANEYRRGTLAIVGRNKSGLAATAQSLKSEIDQCLISGVTQIIIDGGFFTLDQRSYLKTPHNPVWYPSLGEHFKRLCEYTARMWETLKDLAPSRSVAVFSPSAAIKAVYLPTSGDAVNAGNQLLAKTVNALVHRNLDFETLSEEHLLQCGIKENGEFAKGDRKARGNYLLLVVPYAPFVSRSVLVFLERLVSRRGTIIFVNEAPKGTFEDGVTAAVTKRIERLLNPKKSGSRVVAVDELEKAVAGVPGPVKIRMSDETTPDILCAAGEAAASPLYCFYNRSDNQEYSVKVEVPQAKHLTFIDCDAGTLAEVGEVQQEGDKSLFDLHLLPQRAVILVASASSIAPQPSRPAKGAISPFSPLQRTYRIVLKNQWSFEAETLNTLPLSIWNLRIGLSRESGGFSHFYESYFQVGTLPDECYLLMSMPGGNQERLLGAESMMEIGVNGTRVDKPVIPSTAPLVAPDPARINAPAAPESEAISYIVPDPQQLLGHCTGTPAPVYNVKPLLVKGFNRVSLRTSSVAGEPPSVLYPPLLFGKFSIVKGQSGWTVEKTGSLVGNDSWTKYGYPYLSGTGVYRQSFEVPHQFNRLILRMAKASGIVEIKLNGKSIGKFIWQPIEVDITSLCETKRNELVISVSNTIDNVLRLNGRPSGILGDVYLDVS